MKSQKYSRLFRSFGLVTALIVLSVTSNVSAISGTQRGLFKASVPFFNVDKTVPCGGIPGSIGLVGSDNAEKVYNFFRSKGLEPWQAAGIMGNMHVESVGIEPQRQQGLLTEKIPAENFPDPRGGSGWGVVQWTPGAKFISTQNPISLANDLGVQLNFLWQQLEGSLTGDQATLNEKAAGDGVKSTPNVTEATYAFMGNMLGNPSPAGLKYPGFERPSAANQVASIDERLQYAVGYLEKYGSGTAAPGTPIPGATSGACGVTGPGGEIVSGLALPLERKWYEQHPEWFTKPHHSPPAAADIPVPEGTPVFSMTGGTVLRAPINNGYGLGVEIDSGTGVVIKYAHGTDGGQIVKPGDTVVPGQPIMHVGSTGDSTGPHLHLEISLGGYNGTDVCPQPLLQALYEGQPVPAFSALPTAGCF